MECIVLSLVLAVLSPTNIYTVDDDPGADFATIQAAIQSAADGDTILVKPGLYAENISFNNKAITLTGIDPADPNMTLQTVLNGRILFDFLEGSDSVVTGITLAGRTNQNEMAICTATGVQSAPAIYGNIVVWQDRRGATSDIYAYDLISHVEIPVCTAVGNQYAPAIYGNIVVWQDRRGTTDDIYAYDLSTKTETAICTATGNQYAPAIFGNIVVWQDRRSGADDIYGYDLTTKTEFAVCTAAGTQSAPAIGDRYIVWKDTRSGNEDIYGWDLVDKVEFPICTAAGSQNSPAVSGDIVVWIDNRNPAPASPAVYGYDISEGREFVVCDKAGDRYSPAISGDTIVWQDHRNNNQPDIYGYDIPSQAEFSVCKTSANQNLPAIDGEIVVWQDSRAVGDDIYGVTLPNRALRQYLDRMTGISTAILCKATSPTLSGLFVIGIDGTAIECQSAAAPSLSGSWIESCTTGILGSGGPIHSNTITKTVTAIKDCAGAITENVVEQNKVAVENGAGTISGNRIQFNTTVAMKGCTGRIAENEILSNLDVALLNCSGTVSGNRIAMNLKGGLQNCDGEIADNQIASNGLFGLSGCDGSIHGNFIADNYGDGVASCTAAIANNRVAGNRAAGLYACTGAIRNNTIVENLGDGIESCNTVVKNNIIAFNKLTGIYGPATNSYNCLWQNAGGNFFNNFAKIGDIYADPLFAANGVWDDNDTPGNLTDDAWTAGDYHLRSAAGRWVSTTESWVVDSVTSPCIDAGDPADEIVYEPNPNGGRINQGAYGGSAQASRSSAGTGPLPKPRCLHPPAMDFTGDCRVNLADFAVFAAQWLTCGLDQPTACSQP